jgi:hypothetical protein
MEFVRLLVVMVTEVIIVVAAGGYSRRVRSAPAVWLAVAASGTLLLTVVSLLLQLFVLPVMRVTSQAFYVSVRATLLAIQGPVATALELVIAASLFLVLRHAGAGSPGPHTEQALPADSPKVS